MSKRHFESLKKSNIVSELLNEKLKSESELLAEAHWSYIKQVLENSNENEIVINKIGFHYKTAFVHGYKHAIEKLHQSEENKVKRS